MNDFREFQREYNNWLMHKQHEPDYGTGGTVIKYQNKSNKPGDLPPKPFVAWAKRNGWGDQYILDYCQSLIDGKGGPMSPDSYKWCNAVMRLIRNGQAGN